MLVCYCELHYRLKLEQVGRETENKEHFSTSTCWGNKNFLPNLWVFFPSLLLNFSLVIWQDQWLSCDLLTSLTILQKGENKNHHVYCVICQHFCLALWTRTGNNVASVVIKSWCLFTDFTDCYLRVVCVKHHVLVTVWREKNSKNKLVSL